jgi:hypothetical protein
LATILYLFYVDVVTTLFRLKRLGVLLVLLGGTICSALSIALVACDYPDLVLAGPALIAVGSFFTACASVAFWAFFVLIGWMDDPGIEWLPARW